MTTVLNGSPLVTLAALAMSEMGASHAAFQNTYKEPVVLIHIPARADFDGTETGDGILQATPSHAFHTHSQTRSPVATASAWADAAVVPVAKGGRNSFEQMITVGRASNNDIIVPVNTVSKFQGFFAPDGRGGWSFVDARSTNGSWIGGTRLYPHRPQLIGDGTDITLGFDVHLLFRTPEGLWEITKLLRTRLSS